MGYIKEAIDQPGFDYTFSTLFNNLDTKIKAGVYEGHIAAADSDQVYEDVFKFLQHPVTFNDALINDVSPYQNNAPTVSAGANLSVRSDQVASAIIHGTGADQDQGDVLSCRWLEGSSVLRDWSSVGAGGECPLELAGLSSRIGAHILVLEVSDSKVTASDDMILTIDNSAPHAVASGAGFYRIGSSIPLYGQVSDYDVDMLNCVWKDGARVLCTETVATIPGGAAVSLPEECHAVNLGLGDHTVLLEASDGVNPPAVSTMIVNVFDHTKPTLAPIADKTILWPPNHGMVYVTISANAADNSGLPVSLSAAVSSNEPQDGLGDGDTAPDWTAPVVNQETGVITLQLRAERSGKGSGRQYVVRITATDEAGNESAADVKIIVPHDRAKK